MEKRSVRKTIDAEAREAHGTPNFQLTFIGATCTTGVGNHKRDTDTQ